jgi:hypothetical protein
VNILKKILVSTIFGVLLLSSLTLLAKGKDEPVQVVQLEVVNQLSIGAHEVGEESYIQQVGVSKPRVVTQEKTGLPMTTVSFFWVMATGLLFFVARSTARRIK